MAGTLKSPDELVEMFVGLISKYPAIVALIDPFRKEVSRFYIWSLKCFVARILTNTLLERIGVILCSLAT